jgi:hypothetical protein
MRFLPAPMGSRPKRPVYAAVPINRTLVRIVQKTNGATAVRAANSRTSRTRLTEKGPVSRSGVRGLRGAVVGGIIVRSHT